MPSIITSKRLYYSNTNRPPIGAQIDWKHSITKNLVGCWLMNEQSGVLLKDIAYNSYAIMNSAAQRTLWRNAPRGSGFTGRCPDFEGTSSPADDTNVISCITRPRPPIWVGPTAGNGWSMSMWFFKEGDGGGWLGYWMTGNVVSMRNEGTNRFVYQWNGTTNINVQTVDNAYKTSYWSCVLLTHDGSVTATNVHIYVNGRESAYAIRGDGSALLSNSGTAFVLGNNAATGGIRSVNGMLTNVQVWNRVLQPAEAKTLYEAPYQFISPIKHRTYFIPDGVAPPATVTGIMTPRTNYWGDL